MRRIVVIAGSLAGIKSAVRIKRRLPEHEVNVIVPAAVSEFQTRAQGGGFAAKRHAEGLPDLKLLSTREVGIIEATDIMPDLEAMEIVLSSSRGNVTIRYSDLVIEVPATVRLPRALQRAENVFGWPMSGFSASPELLDTALSAAVGGGRPVVVVGGGMPALDAVCLAKESGAAVHWLRTGEETADIDPHLLALVLQHFGEEVRCTVLSEMTPESLPCSPAADGRSLAGISLPDGTLMETALCLWTFPLMGKHPLLRETGVTLDKHGRIFIQPDMAESLRLHLMGSGASLPYTLLSGSGAALPCFPGAQDSANVNAWQAVDSVAATGAQEAGSGFLSVWEASCPGLRIYKAGIGFAEAERQNKQAERAIVAMHPQRSERPDDSTFVLLLVCDVARRSLLGVQALGIGPDAPLAAEVFNVALADLAAGTSLEAITRRGLTGCSGALLNRAARILTNKLNFPVRGVSPDELLASRAAGAEFFILDLRSQRDWLDGHVQDAYNIPLPQLKKRLQGEVPRFTPLVLISADGNDAYAAACLLAGLGATDLYVLDGGMKLWPYPTTA